MKCRTCGMMFSRVPSGQSGGGGRSQVRYMKGISSLVSGEYKHTSSLKQHPFPPYWLYQALINGRFASCLMLLHVHAAPYMTLHVPMINWASPNLSSNNQVNFFFWMKPFFFVHLYFCENYLFLFWWAKLFFLRNIFFFAKIFLFFYLAKLQLVNFMINYIIDLEMLSKAFN